jgi:hypothetical protein
LSKRSAKPTLTREEEQEKQEKQAKKEAKKAKELARQEEEEKAAKKKQADAGKSMEEFQKELPRCLRELYGSADVDEAVLRLEEFNLEVDEHEASVAQFLLLITEEKEDQRKLGFKLMAGVFSKLYSKSALRAGLESWFGDEDEGYECMKSDLPILPKIVENELLPALSSVLGPADITKIKGLMG